MDLLTRISRQSTVALLRNSSRHLGKPHVRCASTNSDLASPKFGVYGGVEIPYTPKLEPETPADMVIRPAYRVLDEAGTLRPEAVEPEIEKDVALDLLEKMVRLEVMDQLFYDAQRQGRMSFYMTSSGEEAITIGSASGLRPQDMVFAQYREAGVLMYRGFTLQNFADQCYANVGDPCKGRQMPVHYGSVALNYQTISSPLGTQLPQAVGSAYQYKLAGEDRIAACYFGDGAASEGDFHPAMNFAATLSAPVLFICRNNGYAISTPVKDQYRGDGIIGRAIGYGMASLRVDGNDMLAVREATQYARKYVSEKKEPFFLEAMSYRQGHHSTSDDSTRYREVDEIELWKKNSHPITRFRNYCVSKGWWDDERETSLRENERANVLQAMGTAEKKEKPQVLEDLFNDVYAEIPAHLEVQREQLKEQIRKYPEHYTLGDH